MAASDLGPFVPPRWLAHPWAQTLYPQIFPLNLRAPKGSTEAFDTTLGDRIAVTFDHLEHVANGRGVLLLHGLCGSQDSRYIVRLSHALGKLGVVVARMNMRSCGPGMPWAKHPFHSGRSEDLAAVVDGVAKKWPALKWLLVGFSLGGNVLLKYLGEVGNNRPAHVAHALAVSPPIELGQSAAKLQEPRYRWVNRYFVRALCRHALALARTHGEPAPTLPRQLDLRTFDSLYTAPRAGYPSVDAYYHGASAARVIATIARPCDVLIADDDPVIDPSAVLAMQNPNVFVQRISRGGHVAFVGAGASPFSFVHWMDHYVAQVAARTLF